MKTVQDYLNELDNEKIIDCFIEARPIDIKDVSLKEANEKYRSAVQRLINHLKFADKQFDSEHTCVLFAHEVYLTSWEDIDYSLLYLDDVNNERIETYSFSFSPFNEIAAFYVSDNSLTQEHIFELLAYVLAEASFYGFEQEDLEKAKDRLDQAMKDIENGNVESYKTIDEVMKSLGMTVEHDEEKEKLRREINQLVYRYNEYMKRKEWEFIKGIDCDSIHN